MQTAEKGKIVLSANKESHLSIESFIGDYDFKASITRAEFEKEVQDLLDRVSVICLLATTTNPQAQSLSTSLHPSTIDDAC